MTSWLIDTSAFHRLTQTGAWADWSVRIERGLISVAAVTRLGLGYSARSGTELRNAVATPPLSSMPLEHQTPAIEVRAIEVQTMLADAGQHRGPGVADLLVATTAEKRGLTVLHVDRDFELIAEITGQPVERLDLG